MPNTILPGYMNQQGDKLLICFEHSGPTSYTQLTGTAPNFTGGDQVNASDLGVGGFDVFQADMTDATGQLYAYIIPINGGNGNAVPSVQVVWYSRVTATVGGQAQTAGTQVVASTNLSTFTLRIQAWCV